MRKPHFLAAALIFAVAGAASAKPSTPDAELADALKGRVAGAPVDCIDLGRSSGTQIIEGTAIIYRVGSTLYVNWPQGADRLDRWDVLVSKPFGSQLCSPEPVYLHDRYSGVQSGFVSLGQFIPYKKPKGR